MSKKTSNRDRGGEGGRKGEREEESKTAQMKRVPKLGYNPKGIVLIPNTNITTRNVQRA